MKIEIERVQYALNAYQEMRVVMQRLGIYLGAYKAAKAAGARLREGIHGKAEAARTTLDALNAAQPGGMWTVDDMDWDEDSLGDPVEYLQGDVGEPRGIRGL